MKISQPNHPPTSTPVDAPSPRTPHAAHPVSGSLATDDHVQISMLSKFMKALNSQPASHASRVKELSGAISSGRYHVDSEVVSDKLIQEHMRTAA